MQRAAEKANTVAAVVEEYVERRLKPRLKDWQGVAQRLRRDWVTAYGPRPVSSLTRPDILRQLDRMGDRGLKQGRNRALATIRPFLGWCLERGLVENNVALGIKPPARRSPATGCLTTTRWSPSGGPATAWATRSARWCR